jgi:PAS domain S-box-containing protein
MEATATLLAAIVGLLALVRYYSAKNPTLLLVGSGFIGAALLDAYHAGITASGILWRMPTGPEAAGHWSWFASRLFLSLVLVWSLAEWRREIRLGKEKAHLPEFRVYLEVGGLALAIIALVGIVPLPVAIRVGAGIPRPAELIPGFLFGIALVGFVLKGNWRDRPFEVWLVPSLMTAFASQTLFMPFSAGSFDPLSDMAHVLRILSYVFVMIGLVSSMFGLFRQAERGARVIQHTNAALKTEIEERKAAETAALENESKYRTILATIQEGYFEVDLAGNLTLANDSFARLLGYSMDELQRMNYRRYTEDPCSRVVFEAFNHVYRTGESVDSFGWEIIRKDGEHRYAEASAGPIENEGGEVIGFRGIVRDGTPKRRAEEKLKQRSVELARTNEELRQFASVASHDLQEPLRMVAGYTRLLAQRYSGQLDEEADQFIKYAVAGVSRMQHLIEDLLSYSRIQSHGHEFEPVQTLDTLEWALSNLESLVGEVGATVTHDVLPEVNADPTQLGQLFQNLLSNALKFSDHKDARIHVGVERRPDEWIFNVRDNGIGLDPQYGSRIFEIFQRLHPHDEYEGTGIGLAICKRIVERHGGRIWVESMPGEGATFFFALPDSAGSPPEVPEQELELETVDQDMADPPDEGDQRVEMQIDVAATGGGDS